MKIDARIIDSLQILAGSLQGARVFRVYKISLKGHFLFVALKFLWHRSMESSSQRPNSKHIEHFASLDIHGTSGLRVSKFGASDLSQG